MPAITPIYAALLALLFLLLCARVILYRRTHRLSLGDEGDRSLLKRMRVQPNCAEYAPFALVLLLLVDMTEAAPWVVHALVIMLLAGRALHAWGFSASPPVLAGRIVGMILTIAMIFLAALGLLAHTLF